MYALILQAKGPKVSVWRVHDAKKPADESTDLSIREINFQPIEEASLIVAYRYENISSRLISTEVSSNTGYISLSISKIITVAPQLKIEHAHKPPSMKPLSFVCLLFSFGPLSDHP